jgi:hypothetical protein
MNKIQQLGYEYGGTGFTQLAIAKALLDLTSNKFATEVSADLRADLNKGLALRLAEIRIDLNQHYVKQGEAFLPVTEVDYKAFKGAKYHMTVPTLLSIDKTEISKMAQLDKPLHGLVMKPRKYAMSYLTDTVKDIQAKASLVLAVADGKTGTRKPNKNWLEFVNQTMFETLNKKAINAKASADNSYDEDQWLRSVKAFKAEWIK